jgi:hypothetical protein
MCKFNPKNDSRFIDPCIKVLIDSLQHFGIETLSCCCGHGKYPMTIVVKSGYGPFELVSGTPIPRKKKFYFKDKQGVYYIPETLKK